MQFDRVLACGGAQDGADMQGKIALEEHFAIAETVNESKPFVPADHWPELEYRLTDIQDRRLRLMDQHGIEMMLLSLNAPTVQAVTETRCAVEMARRANDMLAEEVAKRPHRFQGLAALPLQDPELAIRELVRCVKELGFVGVLANGFSQCSDPDALLYYDLPQYWPFWAEVERLDVPFYLHPRNPLPQDARIYRGAEWLIGPTWAFGQETAVHALRLMGSGLFDQHPRLQIVIGHMGEGIPFSLWRVDNRNAWVKGPRPHRGKRAIADYFNENFHITVSGNFCTQALLVSMSVIGVNRIMFATDWPFENIDHAADWFDRTPIAPADRQRIGRTNALELFKLDKYLVR
jgi:2,3-dihydroxybenzoate decarboxylase